MTISEHLAAARAAHTRYREIHDRTKNGDQQAMLSALQEALTQRQAADAADPTHSDPAWACDETTPWNPRAARGVSHEDLITFYTASINSLSAKVAITESAVSESTSMSKGK